MSLRRSSGSRTSSAIPKRSASTTAPEFISKEFDLRAFVHGVTLDFSRPGKPTDNAFIESLNGKFRAECLNANWFMSLDEAIGSKVGGKFNRGLDSIQIWMRFRGRRTMNESTLAGRRFLIADDNSTIANAMARVLNAQGFEIVGPAGNVNGAMALIAESERIDGAILDINLRGKMAYPVVDVLRAKGVPIVFMTGYDESSVQQGYSDVPCLRKPVTVEGLLQALFG